jgi:hypothetical protein
MMGLENIFAPVFTLALLVAIPMLTFSLMRRAGIRGATLALALLPPVFLILGGAVFQWVMTLDVAYGFLPHLALAKTIGASLGAISPLLILAVVKWPALDNSRPHVEITK